MLLKIENFILRSRKNQLTDTEGNVLLESSVIASSNYIHFTDVFTAGKKGN